jgi:hypothetical protein
MELLLGGFLSASFSATAFDRSCHSVVAHGHAEKENMKGHRRKRQPRINAAEIRAAVCVRGSPTVRDHEGAGQLGPRTITPCHSRFIWRATSKKGAPCWALLARAG